MLQWNRGRRLTCYGDSSYTYDAGGIRQSKTIGTETHTYYTEDSRIHKEEYRGRKLLYGYDESGIATIECNGQIYYMQKNFQGDIVGLVDGTKKLVAKYVYDAWGNHKVYDANNNESTSANFIGHINPFRYRGYYYDGETGLYYLQTRYYDPSLGRFLNADSIDYADPESFNGFNLYAYCGNNPVMYTDPSGTSWWDDFWNGVGNWFKDNWDIIVGVVATVAIAAASIATFGIATVATGMICGAVIGAGFGALNAATNGDNVLYGMLSGMLVGSLGGIGGPGIGGMLASGFATAAGAATMSLIGDRVNGRTRNFAKAGVSAITAGIFGFLGNGAGNYMAQAGKELIVNIVGNSLGSFIFGAYTFVADLIYETFGSKL